MLKLTDQERKFLRGQIWLELATSRDQLINFGVRVCLNTEHTDPNWHTNNETFRAMNARKELLERALAVLDSPNDS